MNSLMITIKYTINAMGSLSGARSVELIGNHHDDAEQILLRALELGCTEKG